MMDALAQLTIESANDQYPALAAALDVTASPTATCYQWVAATTTKGTLLIAPDEKHRFVDSLPSYNLL